MNAIISGGGSIEAKIKEHIEALQKEKDAIDKNIAALYKASHLLCKKEMVIHCKKHLAAIDQRCAICDHAMPFVSDFDGIVFSYPDGGTDKVMREGARDCREWRKKINDNPYGCGGESKCICGFSETFCFPDRKQCPLCGRDLTTVYYKGMWDDVNKVLEGEEDLL